MKYIFLDLLYDFRAFFNDNCRSASEYMYYMSFGFLPRKFDKGELIYKEGEEIEELYLIRSGIV